MPRIKCACKGDFLDRLLQPVILKELYKEKQHGFALLNSLTEHSVVTGSTPDPTGLYRTLKKMEDGGLLLSEWDYSDASSPKRIYEITDKGKECLATWVDTLHFYSKRIEKLSQEIEEVLK